MNENNDELVELVNQKGDDNKISTTLGNLSLTKDDGKVDNDGGLFSQQQKLPHSVRCRVNALKNVQKDYFKFEADYYEQMSHIEQEFYCKVASLLDKRRDIVNGVVDPTEEESKWEFGPEEEEEGTNNEENGGGDNVKGIPSFWLKALENASLTAAMINPEDIDILESLENITCSFQTPPAKPGFRLEFFFKPNDFFTNSVLHKEYFIRFQPFEANPLSYEGPEIVETRGCNIDWLPGKNVTIKMVKKKVKGGKKNRHQQKTISHVEKVDSFFNFFSPPLKNIETLYEMEEEDEDEELLHADFELGQFFRESLIPKAVLYFTGEIVEDECDPEDFMEGLDDDESLYSDEEEHHDGKAGGSKPTKSAAHHRGKGKKDGEIAPEQCKQQ